MRVGLGFTGAQGSRLGGKSNGIATYSEALLGALRTEFPRDQFCEVTFSLGNQRLRDPLRRAEIVSLQSVFAGRRYIPDALFGTKMDLFHALDHQIPAMTVPVVATVHDACPLSMPHLVPGRFRALKNILYARKCRMADQIVAVSEYSADEISRFIGIDRKKIHVIYEGIAPHIEKEAKAGKNWDVIRQRHGLNRRYVAYCGSITRRKNIVRLIKAFHALPQSLRKEYQLVLIGGTFGGALGEEVARVIAEAEADGDVRWLGRLPDEDMARVLHHAELFAFPSLHEGFGLPIVEAFRLGVPVVTSQVTAMPEISGGASALVDPESVKSISDALCMLLSDSNARSELSALGMRRAGDFSWINCANETAQVYNFALSAT